MPCSVAFANALAGSIRADARAHSARTFAASLPHAAATRGSSQAVSRCTTRHATRGGHRVSNARNRRRTHHRKRCQSDRVRGVARRVRLGLGLGVMAHRSAPSWATGSTRSCSATATCPSEITSSPPWRSARVRATRRTRCSPRPDKRPASSSRRSSAAALRLKGASSSSRDPSIVGVRLDAAGPCDQRARPRPSPRPSPSTRRPAAP